MGNKKTEKLCGSSQKVTAFITARGGSKGLLGKNLYPLNGKPLIWYTIESALNSEYVERCIVSTDDAKIKEVSLGFGAEVIDRPPELAQDSSLSSDVILHLLEELSKREEMPEYFILLQPTSPLRNSSHIDRCLEDFFQSGFPSCFSVSECEHHPYKTMVIVDGRLKPVFSTEDLHKPRQLLPAIYRPNGAIYVCRSESFIEQGSFYLEPTLPFVMTSKESVDIDTINDICYAELIIQESINLSSRNSN
jgi:CMP-N-acetylneuraminic acid synthetase